MAGNDALNRANKAKKDEFYTRREDIEAEIQYYEKHFVDQIVLCNCDDPYESNFFMFFVWNFNRLKLKKLIATCYESSPIVKDQLAIRTPYMIQITEVKQNDLCNSLAQIIDRLLSNKKNTYLKLANGDFRSPECVQFLQEANIIVTNPPFSLFREFVALLMDYEKKFLIIGNQNAITYKEIFPLIQSNKIWLGCRSGDMAFMVPDYYEPRATRYWIDDSGQKWRSMGNICWFTNLDHHKRHIELDLYKKYTPEEYPKYDNYNAINIDKVSDIPYDYNEYMGVPITFLDKFSPEQFEIIGCTESEGKGFSNGLWYPESGVAQPLIQGERKYKRIFIRRKQHENQAP